MRCENCGMFDGVLPTKGHSLVLKVRAENRFKRDSKRTVWCCSDECGVQTLGIAKYGSATRNWPISLSKFRATKPLEAICK